MIATIERICAAVGGKGNERIKLASRSSSTSTGSECCALAARRRICIRSWRVNTSSNAKRFLAAALSESRRGRCIQTIAVASEGRL